MPPLFDTSALRGTTVRRRADVQPTRIERPTTLGARLRHSALAATARLLALAVWAAAMAVWFLAYVPLVGAAVAVVVVLWNVESRMAGLALAAVLVAAGAGWRWTWPDSYDRYVESRADRFARRIRYRWSWADLLASCGLAARDAHHTVRVPRLWWVQLGRYADVLTVQLCPGVTADDIAERADALRSEFHALEVRVLPHSSRRGWCLLRVIAADTLLDGVAPPRTPDDVDLSALELGQREDGSPWLLQLLGRHLLIAGATGAGKSTVVAALFTQLAPAIAAGSVRVIGIDPKGGMEFGLYPDLFWHLACESDAEMVEALELAADLVQARAKELRGVARQHVPTVAEPFYLVVVDEIASLTAYLGDRQLRDRAKLALGRLLTKGRAPGVSVVGCVQDPRKDVLELRNLFTTRIALRLAERSEVAMVLGDGARDRGAYADRIPLTAPGIGYVIEDGSPTVTKVRAGFVDDDQLTWLADTYPTPSRLVPDVIDGEIIDDQPADQPKDAPAPQQRSKARR
jgi:DNA segregation ATPase FtsK/SpoIIIE, S-DNA-T family